MNLSYSPFLIISFLLYRTRCANAEIYCSAAYGGNLAVDDCLNALFTSDRIILDGSVSRFFTQTAEDPHYRLPYHYASPNDACHFGISFEDFGDNVREPTIYTSWNVLRVQALKVISACMNRQDGRGWGGYMLIREYALKLMFWQEEAVSTPSSQGSPPSIGGVQDGGDKVAMGCKQSCVIS